MRYPWICKDCGRPFDEDEWDVARCPECGGDIVDAAECPNCGEPFDPDDGMFCPDCMKFLCAPRVAVSAAVSCEDIREVEINGFLASVFTPAEINEILTRALKDDRVTRGKVRAYMSDFDADAYLACVDDTVCREVVA